MKSEWLILLFIIAESVSASHLISGKIINEQGEGIQSKVQVNDYFLETSKNGKYSATVPVNSIYKVLVSAKGYYPSLHYFSKTDISKGTIPDIELVARKKGRALLLFTGDVMMGRRFLTPADPGTAIIHSTAAYEDSKKILSTIKPYLEIADYTSVNLESPIIKNEPEIKSIKPYTFYSRPESLKALKWAGVDFVNLGNNHIYDYLDIGLTSTLEAINKLSFDYVGAGLNDKLALSPKYLDINKQNFAFTGFVGWPGKVTPNQVASFDKGGAAWGNENNIVDTFRKLADHQGPSIIQYHGSREYGENPDESTKLRLQLAIDQGADLAIGHHPHVIQGFDLYKGKLVAYSLGNFIFDQYHYGTQASMILYVWMDGESFHRAEVVPIYIDKYQPKPAISDINHYVLNRVRYLSAVNEVYIYKSGAHGVITARQDELITTVSKRTIQNNNGSHLFLRFSKETDGLTYLSQLSSAGVMQVNQGNILLPLDSFEWIDHDKSTQNHWKAIDGDLIISPQAAKHGQFGIVVKSNQPQIQLIRKVRIYKDNGSISLNAWVKPQHSGKLQFSIDYDEMNGTVVKERKRQTLSSVGIKANQWQQVSFEFNPPAYKNRGFSANLSFFPESNESITEMMLDDIYFTNWIKNEYIGHDILLETGSSYIDTIKLLSLKTPNKINAVYKTIKRRYTM
ncbi:CapA family protein [Endozoicomonas sp. SM1973]|uniref:CapA family protein n=1 Tax=Spartinivicinus marinus TaxID=2994442 RepID=A0A853ICG2_9GAMM|nr:CapA family protein [Spartinivicinus marinus]MCX4028540.1 CapA family protein [Spartinivicinus marinus]NYZ67207.1 CapA family protein [Spartinivicinus marinus]